MTEKNQLGQKVYFMKKNCTILQNHVSGLLGGTGDKHIVYQSTVLNL